MAGLISGFTIPEYLIDTKPLNPNLFNALFLNENWKDLKKQIIKPVSIKPFAYSLSWAANHEQKTIETRIKNLKSLPSIMDGNFIHAAFIMQGDYQNLWNLSEHSKQLDLAFTDSLSLSGTLCSVKENINWNIFETLKKNKVIVFPRFWDSDSKWKEFFEIIKDSDKSECLIAELKQIILNRSLRWINIDLDNIDNINIYLYTNWLISLAESFHEDNLYVTINIPADKAELDFQEIWLIADIIIIKAFNEHSEAWKPWPIAWKYWFEEKIYKLSENIPTDKIIVAIGSNSYDWNITSKTQVESRSFDEIMNLANDTKKTIHFDNLSWNSNFKYTAADWNVHEVWLLDAISAWNQYNHIKKRNMHWFALWRISVEDSTLWNFIPKNHMLKSDEENEVEPPIIHEAYLIESSWLWFLDIMNPWNRFIIPSEGKKEPDNIQLSQPGKNKDLWIKQASANIDNDERNKLKNEESWFLNSFNLWVDNLMIKKEDTSSYEKDPFADEQFEAKPYRFEDFEDDFTFDPKELSILPIQKKIESVGSWEIFKVQKIQNVWEREISLEWEEIVSVKYVSLPQKTKVMRLWDWKVKTIALTFNNGPDKYTEEILDILKKYWIKATFFLRDENISKNPKTVLREYKEGHIIWSRALFYPNEWVISEEIIATELNKTQKQIKIIAGHWSMLVRAPYNINDSAPIKTEHLKAMHTASDLGYILAGANIDSRDFTNPWTEIINKNMLNWLKKDNSNIIIMHDSWWNRAQTVQALEKFIPFALAEWYNFVPLNDILWVQRDALMPEVPFYEKLLILWKPIFLIWIDDLLWRTLAIIFFISTFVSIIRLMFIGLYVYRARKLQKKYYSHEFTPPITILVPAYNEEKVIERTILWLLKSDYPIFEILVIDDWSKDRTAEVTKKLTEKYDNVRLISKQNEGKSLALNLWFKEAKYEYIVTIDADTIVFPKTIFYLIQPFSNKNVDAVCGNILVGNLKNVLTAFQEVEYVIWQNFDRRAFDALNCISVVPWATGAWRKQSVLDAGWYSTDTLVEDADLTLTILENWWRIVYSPLAKSVTEAPEKVFPLFKQRFRWSFGTFQCFWKHRRTFGKGPLWIIALPNMLFFQVIFPLFSPIWDIVLIFALFIGDLHEILLAYLLFLAMDLITAATAYALDKKSISQVWVVFIQRFFYRQFMYFVTYKSIIAALRWVRYGWNKLERKWTVKITNEN